MANEDAKKYIKERKEKYEAQTDEEQGVASYLLNDAEYAESKEEICDVLAEIMHIPLDKAKEFEKEYEIKRVENLHKIGEYKQQGKPLYYVMDVEEDMIVDLVRKYMGGGVQAGVENAIIKDLEGMRLIFDDRQLEWGDFVGVIGGVSPDEFEGAFMGLEELKYPTDFQVRLKKGEGFSAISDKYPEEQLNKMLDYQGKRNEDINNELNKIINKAMKKYANELKSLGLEDYSDMGEPWVDGYGVFETEVSPENKTKIYAISDQMNEEVKNEFIEVVKGYPSVFDKNVAGATKKYTTDAEYVNAEDVFDDDNNGLKYGVEWWDSGTEPIEIQDVQWFKTEKERADFAKKNNMNVINAKEYPKMGTPEYEEMIKQIQEEEKNLPKREMGKHGNAVCDICKKEMTPNNSGCWSTLVDKDGKKYKRVKYGDEGGDTSTPCPDCNTKAFGYHHFGCDNERCPVCGGQMIGCDCPDGFWVGLEKSGVKGSEEDNSFDYVYSIKQAIDSLKYDQKVHTDKNDNPNKYTPEEVIKVSDNIDKVIVKIKELANKGYKYIGINETYDGVEYWGSKEKNGDFKKLFSVDADYEV